MLQPRRACSRESRAASCPFIENLFARFVDAVPGRVFTEALPTLCLPL